MPQSTAVKCANCGATVPASTINIQEMVAICPECDHMFRLQGTVKHLEQSKQRKVKAPETFDVLETDREVHISYRHLYNMTGLDKVSNVFWGLGIILFAPLTIVLFSSGGLVELIGGSITLVLTLIVLYIILLNLLNTRRIVMDEEMLSWYEEPLYIPIRGSFSLNEIERLSIQPSRAAEKMSSKGLYEVLVHRHDGTSDIFLDFLDRVKALYIQQTLEAHLLGDSMADDEIMEQEPVRDEVLPPIDEDAQQRFNGSR